MISFHIFSGTFLSIPARFCHVFAIFKVKFSLQGHCSKFNDTNQIRNSGFLDGISVQFKVPTQTFDISLLLLSLVRSESRREGLKSKTTSLLFLSAIGDFQSCTQLAHL